METFVLVENKTNFVDLFVSGKFITIVIEKLEVLNNIDLFHIFLEDP